MSVSKYQVLLFYKYVRLPIPELIKKEQIKLCVALNLKGRIILAEEGINGTLEGLKKDTKKYIAEMDKSDLFKDISFKKSEGTGSAFPKLSIKVRREVVTAKIPIDPTKVTGKYITSDLLHQWIEEKKEFYIVDMRNDYEYQSGHFENFIPSGIHNFYDLPDVLPKLKHLKNKTIVTVCTGGIRCEKASGFLVNNGFEDVYQLKDGIQTYMEKYPNEHFLGKLYVFDNRLTLGFNIEDPKHKIVGKCLHCGVSCDSYVNCEYDICHFHYISCQDCMDRELGLYFDKKECKEKYLKSPQYAKVQGMNV
ncbi:MAG TPA: rhodanese-related sulfurtransferase [Candidatus Saccharimonadales bacterium]|nr:rhodanese-related sulfurtransferase [Candidatus Saccharimonadales bacterium]